MINTNQSIQKSGLIVGYSLFVMTIISLVVFASLKATPLSIIGIIIIIILDVVIGLALITLLKPTNSTSSYLVAVLRIIYAVVFLAALIKISDLDTFYLIWDKGLIIFGFHLLFLGILLTKANYIPNWLGLLVTYSSIGYIIDGLGVFLGFEYNITMYTFFGEVIFGIWLMFKAKKIQLSTD
jgi:hypothetical protein